MNILTVGSVLSNFVPRCLIADEKCSIIWSSKHINELFPKKSLLNHSLHKTLGIDIEAILKKPVTLCVAHLKNYQVYGLKMEDGAESYYLVVLEPLQDLSHPSIRLACLETILNTISDGVVVSDCDGRVVVYNAAQELLENLHAHDMVGKFLWDAYHYAPDNESEHRRVYQSGKPVLNQYQAHAYNNGIPQYVTYSTYPLILDGQKIGVYSISKNETKLQSLLAETMELKRRFIQVNSEVQPSKHHTNGTTFTFSDIIGTSSEMEGLIHEAQTIALLENNVLIVGETGSGKEVFAQSMHNFSKNSTEPFVGINCAAIPENLLESILFGAVKGAYTGALDHQGLFEEAGTGTLFLDELNSLPIGMQSKLLRALQERKVRRVGGVDVTPIKCRVICATNEDPHHLIQSGKLRQDLYYRIAGLCLYISPLRDRPEDVLALGLHFIKQYNKVLSRSITGFSESLTALIKNYSWPGNTRELEHFVENLMVRTQKGQRLLTPDDLPPYLRETILRPSLQVRPSLKDEASLPKQLRALETKLITEALEKNQGNISASARDLGIIRQSLLYRLEKLGLEKDSPRF